MSSWTRVILAVASTLFTCAANAQETVFVIRHAEQEFTGADPELRPKGTERAAYWARVLEPSGLDVVVTSDLRRSQRTGAIIAEGLALERLEFGKHDYKIIVEYLRDNHPEDTILIVGHSGTISPLLREFGHSDRVSISKADYGGLFIVTPIDDASPIVTRLKVDPQ